MKTPDDAYNLKLLSTPFVSGDYVYFAENWIEDNRYRSSVFRFDGKNSERITFGGHERSPLVIGCKLYYISHSEDMDHLTVIDGVKEPERLYSNRSISKFVPYNDSFLIITQDTYEKDRPFVTDRVKYRFDTTGFLWTRKKLVVLGEQVREAVHGDFDVVDVATNGTRVVFSATIEDDDHSLEDIYELNVSDFSYRRVTEGEGKASPVCVSESGEIAYVGHRKGAGGWAAATLMFPEKGKEVSIGKTAHNKVGTDLFVPASEPLVYSDGRYYITGQEGDSSFVYAYDGNNVTRLTDDRRAMQGFHVRGDKLAYIYTSPEKPSILTFGSEYDPNPSVTGCTPEKFSVNGMDAWLILNSKDSPTVLSVHGGPHAAYGQTYSIEFNFLAENGLNVLFGNPGGSDGYGEEFTRRVVGDWGGKDYEDIMSFMDQAMQKYGLKDNFAITGGSYGGYMTNAVIVRTSRFKTAIAERCVSNIMSKVGTSDIGFYNNAIESGVEDPWSEEGMKKLLEMSPITHAKSVTTPTMFIHGENDYRCPIEQSEQMYSALKLNGVETQLVRYPGDSHEHARRGVPKNMKDRLTRKVDWFIHHMKA